MTAITILRDDNPSGTDATAYHAITRSGNAQSWGRTAGEALDTLTRLLPDDEAGTLIVVQEHRGDAFFAAAQIQRLQELMQRAQSDIPLTVAEEAERKALIEAELLASAARCAALADALGK